MVSDRELSVIPNATLVIRLEPIPLRPVHIEVSQKTAEEIYAWMNRALAQDQNKHVQGLREAFRAVAEGKDFPGY